MHSAEKVLQSMVLKYEEKANVLQAMQHKFSA